MSPRWAKLAQLTIFDTSCQVLNKKVLFPCLRDLLHQMLLTIFEIHHSTIVNWKYKLPKISITSEISLKKAIFYHCYCLLQIISWDFICIHASNVAGLSFILENFIFILRNNGSSKKRCGNKFLDSWASHIILFKTTSLELVR